MFSQASATLCHLPMTIQPSPQKHMASGYYFVVLLLQMFDEINCSSARVFLRMVSLRFVESSVGLIVASGIFPL